MCERVFVPVFLLISLLSVQSGAQQPTQAPSIAAKTAGLKRIDGFVPLYWDAKTGKMWLEIDHFNEELLYITALSAGVGSNDLGLDRGRMNEPKVVQFERSGPKVLLVESNYRFRATSGDPAERRAEADSFARSVLWGFEVSAEEGPRVLVDATAFLLRDAARIADDLVKQKQGNYRLDPSRTAFDLDLTKSFPRNTEIETTVTFAGEPEGHSIAEVTPSPEAVTVREHQAFVALPPPGYKPRLQDPRSGFSSINFMDFSTPLDQPVMQRWIMRHRLEKKDPAADVSDPVEPVIYYVDSGAPEPIRSALVEGARWWNEAFESAGYRNAFQVKLLPPDVDPMDVRYNVVQWVHRSTRGWSYGNSLVDPRTGEIIKGIVTLGSLRARQDYLIFEGFMAPYADDHDNSALLTKTVLARLRQLAAHEVGHTLGLEHNFTASTQGRASVMDYPGPLVELRDEGTLDLSKAYAKGIGEWDKVSIRWGYGQFRAGANERAELERIIADAAKRNLTFITDADSRPLGSAHPQSHLWDNGKDAADELHRMLQVRAAALRRFGQNNVRLGAPMATLDEVLVPLYYSHRYQTEAAAKMLGGSAYTYALRGDGQPVTSIVGADEQRKALRALLETIDVKTLTIPDRVLDLIPPRPPEYPRTRETFPNQTGVTFDPVAAAQAAADLTVSLLLNPQRAARLEQYHARGRNNPDLREVIDALVNAAFKNPPTTGLEVQVAEAVQHIIIDRVFGLAVDPTASKNVRAAVLPELAILPSLYAKQLLNTFERDPKQLQLPKPIEMPPGQPIGDDDDHWPL
jgi:hypothetical protein